MVRVLQDLVKFILPVGRREYVRLPAKFLMAQPRLVKAAGCGSGEIFPDQGIGVVHGKRLLGQQHPAAGLCLKVF